MVLKMVIKMADINGPAKSWKLHQFWTERITEEFFRQVTITTTLSILNVTQFWQSLQVAANLPRFLSANFSIDHN